jgi:hypothetical protein
MDKLQHIKHKHEPQLLLVFRRYDSGLGQVHVCRYGTSGFHACRLINGMSRNFFPNATAKPQHTTTSTMESLLSITYVHQPLTLLSVFPDAPRMPLSTKLVPP